MRKKIICIVASFVLIAVTVINVKIVLEVNHTYDLAMTSIDALSEDGEGDGGSLDQEGTEQDSGGILIKDRKSGPEICSTYRNVSGDGTIIYTEYKMPEIEDWISTKLVGMKDTCPHIGNGCYPYRCHKLN